MEVLPLLHNPSQYKPCSWNLSQDIQGRHHWVDVMHKQLPSLKELIDEEYEPDHDHMRDFVEDYTSRLDQFERDPGQFEHADILALTGIRRDCLFKYGFEDPYRRIKQQENERSLSLLADVLTQIDTEPPDRRLGRAVTGLMAGNIFDLGAQVTRKKYQSGESDFENARREVPPRPWFIDDVAGFRDRWDTHAYQHVLIFVDNAGSDIVLGCIPFARWMLRAGSRVTLAANTRPALNDITANELSGMLPRLSDADQEIANAVAEFRLRVVESGSDLPGLDLRTVSSNCAQMAMDADLVVFLGMARAIETNFEAQLTCDGLWSAVLKDRALAQYMGGALLDCVFRFRLAKTL